MSTETHYTPQTTITDPLFLQGLSSILSPYYARGASPEEVQQVTERAESFYLSQTSSLPKLSPEVESPRPTDEPPYPLSFAHLAHLISTGAPIPGIKDVPDKVTDQVPTQSTREIRRKPWEKESLDKGEAETSSNDDDEKARG